MATLEERLDDLERRVSMAERAELGPGQFMPAVLARLSRLERAYQRSDEAARVRELQAQIAEAEQALKELE